MSIFSRILKTLEVRFFDTDEGIDVFNIICRTIRFAKKGDGPSNCKRNPIGTQTEMDFFRTFDSKDYCSEDADYALKRLRIETSTTHLSSEIIGRGRR